MASQQDLTYELVGPDDVEAAYKIESSVFPPEEAATLEAFRYRQKNAPAIFLGAFQTPRTLVGYIASTLSLAATLSHESMSTHVPDGTSVCIHAVAVTPSLQRKGIAVGLLKEYISRLEKDPKIERLLLITHSELRSLYEKAGFEWVGKSSVVHGPREWFEMRRVLHHTNAPHAPITSNLSDLSELPPNFDIAAALARPKSRPRGRLLADFVGLDEIKIDAGNEKTNKYPIVCVNCGSLILRDRISHFREAPSVQLEPPTHPLPKEYEALPPVGDSTSWWLVTPDPMAFENIGFSRPVPSSDSTAPRTKLLSCAECDLGPIGWSLEGGREYWVHCGRVGYRV